MDRRNFLKTLGVGVFTAAWLPRPRGWTFIEVDGLTIANARFLLLHDRLKPKDIEVAGPAAPALDTSWEYDVREGFTSHPSSVISRVQVYLDGVRIGLCVAANPVTGHVLVYSKRAALDVDRDWIAEEEGPCRCEDKRWHIPAKFRNGVEWCVPMRVVYGDVEVRHV